MFLVEHGLRGGVSGAHGTQYIKSEQINFSHFDVHILHGIHLTQTTPYSEIEIDENTSFETLLATKNVAETGYFIEVEIKHQKKNGRVNVSNFVPNVKKLDSRLTDYKEKKPSLILDP